MKKRFWKQFAAFAEGDSLIGGASTDPPAGTVPTPTPDPAPNSDPPVDPPAGGPDVVELLGLQDYVDGENKLLLGKYKDVKGVMDGYREQSKLLREKNPGAPDDYQFDFSKHEKLKAIQPENVANDPLWQAFAPKFKELGITQAQAEGLMETNLLWQMDNMPDLATEKTRLGPEADIILGKVNTLYENAKTDGEKTALEYIGRSADALQLVYKLTQLTGEQGIPANVASHTPQSRQDAIMAAKEYQDKNPDIGSDPAKQKVYDDMLRRAVGG